MELLNLLLHRTCGVARSSKVCLLLEAADVLEDFDVLLYALYPFSMLRLILCQDVLLAYVRTQTRWPGV